jgi:hypothetical protein
VASKLLDVRARSGVQSDVQNTNLVASPFVPGAAAMSGETPPHTGRIYDRTRFGGSLVRGISLDIRDESIYGLIGDRLR